MDVTIPLTSSNAASAGLAASFGANPVSTSQLIMLALAVGGLTILMISTYRRLRVRRTAPRTSAREMYADLQRESAVRHDVERVMLELDQLARQIHGRIDTRFAKLETVIRDADERIEKLSRLARTVGTGDALDVTVSEDDGAASPPTEEVPDERHALVYRLADGGLPIADIAREAERTTGEVELILALRRAKSEADQPAGFAASGS